MRIGNTSFFLNTILVNMLRLTIIVFLGFALIGGCSNPAENDTGKTLRFKDVTTQVGFDYEHGYIGGAETQSDFDGRKINIKEEIAKVREYWSNKEPIPWVKVNSYPGYVHFTHKRHILRGFECKDCHGEVEKMDQVHKVYKLNMGFCITCHTQNAKDQGELIHLRDCLTCHY